MSAKVFNRLKRGVEEALAVARGEQEPYRVYHPIIVARREAAGKVGDEHELQAQGPEIDTSGLPSV